MKSKWLNWFGLITLVVLVALLATKALAAAGDTIRVSVASDGTQANYHSLPVSILADGHYLSADGRYVVFLSDASNLVSGDIAGGNRDVFVHNNQTGITTRVSVDSDGTPANSWSDSPSISANGRYVVFVSGATNLVGGDTNGRNDVFLHDTQTGLTTRVSVASDGTQGNGDPYSPSISADGHFVLFWSYATNLVSGDTNGRPDVFIHDRQTGITSRVSVSSDGTQGNDDSTRASISGDGRYVAFSSNATNLIGGVTTGGGIYLHDMQTGVTTLVSIASDGTQGYGGTPSISVNGRYVAFESPASNMVSGDTNGKYDIFIHDRQTGITTCASVALDGTPGGGDSYSPSLSADGRYVVFNSGASNLVNTDSNGMGDVFFRDTQTGVTTLVSVASDGTQGNGDVYAPSISADGHFVAFGSSSSNLVSGDTNGRWDVFIHETNAAAPTPTPSPIPSPAALPDTGFAPQRGTVLPVQAAEKAFSDLGDLWLEIPRLGVQIPIVGVPQVDGEWDVSWLSKQAGWLNGTSFPTWAGNSVLTGHVYDAYGKPGPFVHLNQMWWGEKVIVHAWGAQYVYEVRQVMQVGPGAISTIIKHEERSWVTLITCRGYDETSDSYKYRVVVRAVLVDVK